MKKIKLHVFNGMNYVYTKALVDMFSENFAAEEQCFFVTDQRCNMPETLANNQRIFCWDNGRRKLDKLMKEADFIVFHFLQNDTRLLLKLWRNKKLLNKCVWRIWGADLYNWRFKRNLPFIGKLLNRIRFRVREHIPYVILEPMDKPTYCEQFGENHIFLEGMNPKGYTPSFLDEHYFEKKDKEKWILIGHSAVPFVHHKLVLDKLSKFSNEELRVVLPLNYGNMQYAEEVKAYATERFKDKCLFIDKKLELKEYVRLLWQCDAAVFHSERQIAMANIIMLMYMNKKIYLKRDSILYNFYTEEGATVFDSEKMETMDFEELFAMTENDNKAYAETDMSLDVIVNSWKKTYEFLEEV